MFELNAEIKSRIDVLAERLNEFGRGDTISHDEIESTLGIVRYERGWNHCVSRIKRYMERVRKITLINVPDVGYKLATHQEQINQGNYRMNRATRQLTRGVRSLRALDDAEGLTISQRNYKALAMRSLQETKRTLAEHAKTTEALCRPTPTAARAKRRLPAIAGQA